MTFMGITHVRIFASDMRLDGNIIVALKRAAEVCGGAGELGRRTGIDPSCISRYLSGKVQAVSDGNWIKLKKILNGVSGMPAWDWALPVIDWQDFQRDPGVAARNGGAERLILRARGLQMAPQICDRDLILVRRRENLSDVPENKIVVAVFQSVSGVRRAVCKRLRKVGDRFWFFSDEPGGKFFPAENGKIVWVGVVLRKISEL